MQKVDSTTRTLHFQILWFFEKILVVPKASRIFILEFLECIYNLQG